MRRMIPSRIDRRSGFRDERRSRREIAARFYQASENVSRRRDGATTSYGLSGMLSIGRPRSRDGLRHDISLYFAAYA